MSKKWVVLFALAGIVCIAVPAPAADFPKQPITYSIAFNPGGQSDLEARRQQPFLEEILGVKVIIQYKPGGGGSVAWAELIQQKPDGYFIAGVNIPHIILQPIVRGDAGYKTEQLTPIAVFQNTPIGIAVMKDSPFQTLQDLVAFAKKNPGAVTAGGVGNWSGPDLACSQFMKLAGIQMTFIPYTGAAPSVAAFLGGHIQVLMGNSNDLVQHRDKLRVLAIGTETRFSHFPDTPTLIESGYDMTASVDRGVAGPPGMPEAVVKVLEKAFLEIARKPEVIAAQEKEGYVSVAMGAAEMKAYLEKKTEALRPIALELMKK
jgi:tripartite-type tricarboxylate transporter receptor subunit TctC